MVTMFRSPNGENSFSGGFFTESTRDGTGEQLVVAVFWRRDSDDDDPPPPSGPDSDEPGVWTGSIGYGRYRIRYSAARRVVRILDRDYELPSQDESLVLLLEDRPGEDRPTVTVSTMPASVAVGTKPSRDRVNKADYAMAYAEFKRAQTMVWNKAVRAHPDVIRFLARG